MYVFSSNNHAASEIVRFFAASTRCDINDTAHDAGGWLLETTVAVQAALPTGNMASTHACIPKWQANLGPHDDAIAIYAWYSDLCVYLLSTVGSTARTQLRLFHTSLRLPVRGLRPHPAAHLSIALSSVRLIDGRTNKSLALCIIPCEIPCVPCPCMPCVCRVLVRCRAVGRVLLLSLVPASINQWRLGRVNSCLPPRRRPRMPLQSPNLGRRMATRTGKIYLLSGFFWPIWLSVYSSQFIICSDNQLCWCNLAKQLCSSNQLCWCNHAIKQLITTLVHSCYQTINLACLIKILTILYLKGKEKRSIPSYVRAWSLRAGTIYVHGFSGNSPYRTYCVDRGAERKIPTQAMTGRQIDQVSLTCMIRPSVVVLGRTAGCIVVDRWRWGPVISSSRIYYINLVRQ